MARKVESKPCDAVIEVTYLEKAIRPCGAGKGGETTCMLDWQREEGERVSVAVAAGACMADKLGIRK